MRDLNFDHINFNLLMMYGVLLLVILLAYLLLIQNRKNQAKYAASQRYIEEDQSPVSAKQVRIIRESWGLIFPHREKLAELFYNRLFELDPDVRSLFRGRLDFQGDKFTTTLRVVIDSLDDFHEVEAILQAMGKRHVIYGIQAAHYETMGAALLWAIKQCLEENYDQDIEAAWIATYGAIATTMKDAAYVH